jgi:4,5-dihydroxyphthalate decarboxylase
MHTLTLSLACGDYDRTRAVFDGRAPIDGCTIIPLAMPPEEAFPRALRHQSFDISELSMASHMTQVDRGTNAYIAVPVVPSRLFRHSSIYVRRDRGIAHPSDLKGRLVGVPEYQITAAVWVRGILQDEYGVLPADLRWRTGGVEQAGRTPSVTLKLPGNVDVSAIPDHDTLSAQLDRGDIDALVSAMPPSCMKTNREVGRLFPDYKAAESEYFAKTGIFPTMHLVGIRKRLVEEHPWLPFNVFRAFARAKELCYARLETLGHLYTTLPWPVAELEQTRALLGQDFWRYGVDENRKEIDALARYLHEQGLTARRLTAEDVFHPSTFSIPKL